MKITMPGKAKTADSAAMAAATPTDQAAASKTWRDRASTARELIRSTTQQARAALTQAPLTRLGWTVLAAAGICWLLAIPLGWIELAVFASICLLVLLIAIPFVVGHTGVETSLELQSSRLVVGEPAAANLTVTNTSGRRQWPFDVDLPVGKATAVFAMPSLAAGDSRDELIVIPTDRRAVIPIGPARAVRGDALGLMRRGVPAGQIDLLYVHPRTTAVGGLQQGLLRDLEGAETTVLSNSDLAFHTLREYVPGDDRRHIHWRTSAKAGELMVRQFVDSRRSQVTIAISARAEDYRTPDDYELAVSIVGSIGLQALTEQQSLHVFSAGEALACGTHQRLLDSLSGIDPMPTGGDLSTCLRAANRATPITSSLVVVTGSTMRAAEVRAIVQATAPSALPMIIRADAQAPTTFTKLSGVSTLDVASLADLRRTMMAVST